MGNTIEQGKLYFQKQTRMWAECVSAEGRPADRAAHPTSRTMRMIPKDVQQARKDGLKAAWAAYEAARATAGLPPHAQAVVGEKVTPEVDDAFDMHALLLEQAITGGIDVFDPDIVTYYKIRWVGHDPADPLDQQHNGTSEAALEDEAEWATEDPNPQLLEEFRAGRAEMEARQQAQIAAEATADGLKVGG